MCLPCPARVPNINMHLNRRRMSPVHPTFTLRSGDLERSPDKAECRYG